MQIKKKKCILWKTVFLLLRLEWYLIQNVCQSEANFIFPSELWKIFSNFNRQPSRRQRRKHYENFIPQLSFPLLKKSQWNSRTSLLSQDFGRKKKKKNHIVSWTSSLSFFLWVKIPLLFSTNFFKILLFTLKTNFKSKCVKKLFDYYC